MFVALAQLAVNILFCEDREPLSSSSPFLDGARVVEEAGGDLAAWCTERDAVSGNEPVSDIEADVVVLWVNVLHASIANETLFGRGGTAARALQAAELALGCVMPSLHPFCTRIVLIRTDSNCVFFFSQCQCLAARF